jgi:acyl carrier protein phosphodiesterase
LNYLAHLYLAQHSDEALLGAMLGDFVAGSNLDAYPPEVRREIQVHRRIDSYTDAHPEVLGIKVLFPQGQRRYAGILLDVYFDHLLARDWPARHPQTLDEFSRRAYRVLLQHPSRLPERLRTIAPRMAAGDWLGSYRARATVDLAVERIARRLSRRGDQLVACLPILRAHEAQAESSFARFFPALVSYAAQARAELG